MIIIAKNVSVSDQEFLGAVVPAAGEIDLTNQYTLWEIQRSDALVALITSGDIVINDGTGDLSVADALGVINAIRSVNGQAGDVVLDPDDLDDSATTNKFVDQALIDKVATIEDSADVTDSVNVDAAGAVMESDTSVAAMNFVIDDDSMATATDTVIPTAESVVSYIAAQIAAVSGAGAYQGSYNVATNTPDLEAALAGVIQAGYIWDVTTSGTFTADDGTIELEAGDVLLARVNDAANVADWTVLQANLTSALIKTRYESNSDTNAFDDAYKAAVDANTAKVSNATHTGEVTGSGALTLDKTAIVNRPVASLAQNDKFLFADSDDLANLKQIDADNLMSDLITTGVFALPALDDQIVFTDDDDADNLKRTTLEDIKDLVTADVALLSYALEPTWEVPENAGTVYAFGGSINSPAVTRLGKNLVAHYDYATDSLEAFKFDEGTGTWASFGTPLTVTTNTNQVAMETLVEGPDIVDIVMYNSDTDVIQAYRWDGDTFATLGNTFGLVSGLDGVSMAVLNTTDIVMVDGTTEDIQAYRFDGTNWATLGNPFNIPGLSYPSITALNVRDIAFIAAAATSATYTDKLMTFRFDGTDWAVVGTSLDLSPISAGVAIEMLNATDVALIENGLLTVYRFNGELWESASPGFGTGYSTHNAESITAIDRNQLAITYSGTPGRLKKVNIPYVGAAKNTLTDQALDKLDRIENSKDYRYGDTLTVNADGEAVYQVLVWKTIDCLPVAKDAGGTVPSFTTFRGGAVRAYAFAVSEELDFTLQIPHDYAAGTDIYLYLHWSHNGTTITGNMTWDYALTYAKAHDQAIFPAEVSGSATFATVDIATTPQYQHRNETVQISAAAPGAGQIDSDDLEPNGLLMLNVSAGAIPTITGGSPNEPFLLTVGIAYQSDIGGTLNKEPNFYE